MKWIWCFSFIILYFSLVAQDSLVPKVFFLKKNTDLTVDTINDTLFFHIHQYEINFKTFGISTGNGVSPFYDFCNGYILTNPFWLTPFSPYYMNIQQRYMHTRYPFTHLRLIANTNRTFNEEVVSALHSQNINKKWNVFFNGESNKRIGKIPHQENRYHHLYASTNYQGNQYQLWANYYYSRLKIKENGGVLNPEFLTDSLFPYENAQVYLTRANNRYTIQHAYVRQLFTFSKSDSIVNKYRVWWIQQATYNRSKKIYTDDMPDSTFYPNIFNDSLKTYDSLFYEQQHYSVGFLYANKVMNGSGLQFLFTYSKRNTYSFMHPVKQNGLTSELTFSKRWQNQTLLSNFSYGFYGYVNHTYKGQIVSISKISIFKKTFHWRTSFLLEKKEADPFLQHFYSNHYRWEKTIPLSTLYLFETSVTHQMNLLKVSVRRIDNLAYFDSTSQPKVINSVNVFGCEATKLFRIKNLFSYHKILIQGHDNSNVRLPWFTAYHSLYIQQKLFKKVLTVQFGADVWYHSSYSVLSYSPVLNIFYLSNQSTQAGFYPVGSVFLNAYLKRARFFVKIEHINHQWQKANFFLVNRYPLPPRMLKFGVFWNFYD